MQLSGYGLPRIHLLGNLVNSKCGGLVHVSALRESG
jgi:hypothetical protein